MKAKKRRVYSKNPSAIDLRQVRRALRAGGVCINQGCGGKLATKNFCSRCAQTLRDCSFVAKLSPKEAAEAVALAQVLGESRYGFAAQALRERVARLTKKAPVPDGGGIPGRALKTEDEL